MRVNRWQLVGSFSKFIKEEPGVVDSVEEEEDDSEVEDEKGDSPNKNVNCCDEG